MLQWVEWHFLMKLHIHFVGSCIDIFFLFLVFWIAAMPLNSSGQWSYPTPVEGSWGVTLAMEHLVTGSFETFLICCCCFWCWRYPGKVVCCCFLLWRCCRFMYHLYLFLFLWWWRRHLHNGSILLVTFVGVPTFLNLGNFKRPKRQLLEFLPSSAKYLLLLWGHLHPSWGHPTLLDNSWYPAFLGDLSSPSLRSLPLFSWKLACSLSPDSSAKGDKISSVKHVKSIRQGGTYTVRNPIHVYLRVPTLSRAQGWSGPPSAKPSPRSSWLFSFLLLTIGSHLPGPFPRNALWAGLCTGWPINQLPLYVPPAPHTSANIFPEEKSHTPAHSSPTAFPQSQAISSTAPS